MKGMDLGGFLFLSGAAGASEVSVVWIEGHVCQSVRPRGRSFIHSVYLSVCHSFIDVEEQMGVICVLHNVQSICR